MAARRLAARLGALVHRLKQEMGEVELFEPARIERVLRIDELQLVAGTLHERRAGLGAHADPVDRARHGQACRWSRWRSRSPSRAAPRSAPRRLAASARRRSAPRRAACRNCRARPRGKRRRGPPAWRTCRRQARRCRRNRCRRNCRWRRRGPPRGPTTDCSRRSGRTRPARPVCAPSPCSV